MLLRLLLILFFLVQSCCCLHFCVFIFTWYSNIPAEVMVAQQYFPLLHSGSGLVFVSALSLICMFFFLLLLFRKQLKWYWFLFFFCGPWFAGWIIYCFLFPFLLHLEFPRPV